MSDNLTSDRIVAAARTLIKSQGSAASVTVGQVAAAAHVSRATLYRYFPDKAALLHACGPLRDAAEPLSTRGRIVQATIQLVSERGLHATTLDVIAERAGVSRSGLQWHFRNKDELIGAVAQSIPVFDLTARASTVTDDASPDCAAQLRRIADAILDETAPVRQAVPFLIAEVFQHADVAHLISAYTLGPLLAQVIALFARFERSGELRPGSAQVRAQSFFGIVLSLLIMKPAFPQFLTGDEKAVIYEQIDILLNGISAHPQKDAA